MVLSVRWCKVAADSDSDLGATADDKIVASPAANVTSCEASFSTKSATGTNIKNNNTIINLSILDANFLN